MDNETSTSNGIRPWQWVVTAVVIIVLIIVGIMVFSRKGVEAPAVTSETPSTTTEAGAINRIIVSDQYPGNVVYISSVQLANPGWIVIQTNDSGKPGKIIGSTFAPSGINPSKVTLTQPMIDGGTYYAVLYSDNGDGKFEASLDKPLTDSNGSIIMKVFKATASANSETKG
ncbi:MAG: hypothetical protein WCO48_02970 [Candidatus Taylorbacteria bacterium]